MSSRDQSPEPAEAAHTTTRRYKEDDESTPWDYHYWPDVKKKAWDAVGKHPNAYYNRYTHPGIPQAAGKWSMEDHDMFMDTLKMCDPVVEGWGMFAYKMMQSGRIGNQCRTYYFILLAKGTVKDSRYVDEAGNLLNKKKTAGGDAAGVELDGEPSSKLVTASPGKVTKKTKGKTGRQARNSSDDVASDDVTVSDTVAQDLGDGDEQEEQRGEEEDTHTQDQSREQTPLLQPLQQPKERVQLEAAPNILEAPQQQQQPPAPLQRKEELPLETTATPPLPQMTLPPQFQLMSPPLPPIVEKFQREPSPFVDVQQVSAPITRPTSPVPMIEDPPVVARKVHQGGVTRPRPSATGRLKDPHPKPLPKREEAPLDEKKTEQERDPYRTSALPKLQSFPDLVVESLIEYPLYHRFPVELKKRRKEERVTLSFLLCFVVVVIEPVFVLFALISQLGVISETLQKVLDEQKEPRRYLQQSVITQQENLLCSFEREVILSLKVCPLSSTALLFLFVSIA